jgi:hypothetical protein
MTGAIDATGTFQPQINGRSRRLSGRAGAGAGAAAAGGEEDSAAVWARLARTSSGPSPPRLLGKNWPDTGDSQPKQPVNDAPCPPFTSHGASLKWWGDTGESQPKQPRGQLSGHRRPPACVTAKRDEPRRVRAGAAGAEGRAVPRPRRGRSGAAAAAGTSAPTAALSALERELRALDAEVAGLIAL